MFFIWRGAGWLTPVIVFGTYIAMDFIYSSLSIDKFSSAAFSLFVSGILLGLFGYYVNVKQTKKSKPECSANIVTASNSKGKPLTFRFLTGRANTLFFVPIQYWSVFAIAISIISYRANISDQKLTSQFITVPKVGDVYMIDYKIFSDEYKSENSISAWKVHQLLKGEVVFITGDYVYRYASDIVEAIDTGKMFSIKIKEEDLRVLDLETIQMLWTKKGIIRIRRDIDNS
ncbi:hypothetical protein L3V77_02845 [Vibrio sp. DW001]|uniref:hypothetical protein n=1 Tax=Vibrio sp. DW001 TaxID=2912315 RepID=UPI0023B0213D|nr:hypothetical protein [Vibrio sp. DW001]WED27190.1 hypothetical protein L3V77_02845 [Vibrio sp. DW001]